MSTAMLASNSQAFQNCPSGFVLGEEKDRLMNDPILAGKSTHALAELFLKVHTGKGSKEALQREYEVFRENNLHYNAELENHALEYVGYCMGVFHRIKGADDAAEVLVEERVDFGSWLPERWGFVDFAVVGDNTLEIVDMKAGRMKVSAKNNSQLMLYALALMKRYYIKRDITKIALTVVQPQLAGDPERIELSVDELLQYGESHRERLQSLDLRVDANAKHCDQCGLRSTCKHAAAYNLRMAGYILEKDPELHDVAEVGAMLTFIKTFEEYAKEFKAYWSKEALERKTEITGYKAAHGQVRRQYTDEQAVLETLFERYPQAIDQVAPRKPLPITKLEQLIGQEDFDELFTFRGKIKSKHNNPRLVEQHVDAIELNQRTDLNDLLLQK